MYPPKLDLNLTKGIGTSGCSTSYCLHFFLSKIKRSNLFRILGHYRYYIFSFLEFLNSFELFFLVAYQTFLGFEKIVESDEKIGSCKTFYHR